MSIVFSRFPKTRKLKLRPATTAASTSQGGQPTTSTGTDEVVVDSRPTRDSGLKSVAGHSTNKKTEAEVNAAVDGPKTNHKYRRRKLQR